MYPSASNEPALQTPVPDAQAPLPNANPTIHKRIVVCCDGTWLDGIGQPGGKVTSNVLKLTRVLTHTDMRYDPPIPQIVFYQSGIGSGLNVIDEVIDGVTGASLGEKVQEAYAFIAHNYAPGDEIFLFGFSRGAYTARMVAGFIGAIGILSRKDMDMFADLFVGLQRRGKAKGTEREEYDRVLAQWLSPQSTGHVRADQNHDAFTVKCVGVWETVGALGLPEELTRASPTMRDIFGFPDNRLGPHIERALHAMAIDERRADFNVAKFEMSEDGRARGQLLKQDVGGGFAQHDLSDIALTWMIANVEDLLAIDREYLTLLPAPVAPWGVQKPHKSKHGVYLISKTLHRPLPSVTDDRTCESIHPSALHQTHPRKDLVLDLEKHPKIVAHLAELELEIKTMWPGLLREAVAARAVQKEEKAALPQASPTSNYDKVAEKIKGVVGVVLMRDESGKNVTGSSWETRLALEGMTVTG